VRFDVLTIFPEMLTQFVGHGIPRKAIEAGALEVRAHDLRDWSGNKYRGVDDYPYGGGGGMVLRAEPFYDALEALLPGEGPAEARARPAGTRVVMASARGRPFDQARAREYAGLERVVFLCGHYKGIDARVDELCDEELSLGDFCLSGGEVAAIAVLDAVSRLLPDVVGCFDSVAGDSHWEGLLGPPEYTRPEEFRGRRVPEVLLSGHHARIESWRKEQALAITRVRRPDLLGEGEGPACDLGTRRPAEASGSEARTDPRADPGADPEPDSGPG